MTPAKIVREVHGRAIGLSSLDKIIFPEDGITKGDVIRFYENMANTMLPYVRDRFMSMHRFPDGIRGKHFYQKDTPDYFPDWIRTLEVEKKDGTNCQIAIEEPATLVYLAQQACLTPHIWLSRIDAPDHPDRLVFDFDPASQSWERAFGGVRWAARELRALLDSIGLTSFVMTSGSRGLHVHVPVRPTHAFDAAKRLARDVAELLARRYPDRLTTEIRKNKREGRIFIDFLRNDYAQTAVAPYALRARRGAPVATPIEWDELSSSGMGPRRYTLSSVFRRLGQKQDPWRGMDGHARSIDSPRQKLDRLLESERSAAGHA